MRLLEYGALALILSLTGMEPLQKPSVCRTTIEFVSYDVRGRNADQKANDIAKRVLLEVKELDRNYDAQTAHGRSEGLWSVTD